MRIRDMVRLASALVAGACLNVQAQDFPANKPLTLVVGFSPGGAIDTTARIVARKLGDNLKQTVVVSNKPGAGGNIAQLSMLTAPADGSTVLLASIGSLTINPHLMAFSYDPLKDLAPITMGVEFPNVLVVNAELGVKTVADLVALAKKTRVDFASSGVGSASHVAGEMFNQRAGIRMTHIAYKGGNLAMLDLLAGRVAAYYAAPPSAQPYIDSGKVVAIATTGLERTGLLPQVPTMAESGFPGFNAVNWYAFVANVRTPASVVERWNLELTKVLRDPAVREELNRHGLTPKPGTREQLSSYMAAESAQWARVIREGNITAE